MRNPLFETADDFLELLAYDKETQGYIRYFPEENFAKIDHLVLTWEGIFVGQVLDWWDNEKEEKEILNICRLFGLKDSKLTKMRFQTVLSYRSLA